MFSEVLIRPSFHAIRIRAEVYAIQVDGHNLLATEVPMNGAGDSKLLKLTP